MALCQLIQNAFSRVKLGEGIGLWQAQGLDDYADAATLAELRGRDEKKDWSRISLDDLQECDSSLSFFDEEGMRFHLPAFMSAALQGAQGDGLIYHLAKGYQCSLLNEAQRAAVRAFLRHVIELPDYEFQRRDILRGLDGYWAEAK